MSLGGWLAFTLYVGAAVADGDTVQRQALHDRVRPQLQELKEDRAAAQRILATIGEIMGADWRPTGPWEQHISAMLGKENGAEGPA